MRHRAAADFIRDDCARAGEHQRERADKFRDESFHLLCR
jgi:hypothetical protein